MQDDLLSRREILTFFPKALALTALSLASSSVILPQKVDAVDWTRFWGTPSKTGQASVIQVRGRVKVGRSTLRRGMKVDSGVEVIVFKGAELLLRLPDESVLKMRGYTRMVLELDSNSGGLFKLIVGSMMGVINPIKERPYLIKGPTATIGVKGTVFFHEVFDENNRDDKRIPREATEYFCVCNGAVDFLQPQRGNLLKSQKAHHHQAYFLSPAGRKVKFKKANFMLDHSDPEIYQAIQQMRGKKHKTGWLRF